MANQQVNMKMVPFYQHSELGREIKIIMVQGQQTWEVGMFHVCMILKCHQVTKNNKFC